MFAVRFKLAIFPAGNRGLGGPSNGSHFGLADLENLLADYPHGWRHEYAYMRIAIACQEGSTCGIADYVSVFNMFVKAAGV